MSPRSLIGALVVVLASLWGEAAQAHSPGQSYIYLRVFDARLEVRLEITATDLDEALGLSLYEDESLSPEEVEAHLGAIRAYARDHVALSVEGEPLTLDFTGFDILDVGFGDFVLLNYVVAEAVGIPDEIDVRYDVLFDTNDDHVNMLVVEHNWRTSTFNNEGNVSLVFTPGDARQTLDLSSSTIWNGFWGLVKLGVWHIWIGLDHILFLLALVLPSVLTLEGREWRPVESFRPAFLSILAIVTCFTLAHSVTLTLAALDVVRLPSRLVESIIAGSIIVAALHNLFPRVAVREWMIAFAFGLFHGFGFASVMGDIGMQGERMALSVLGFNVGVELGQIAIIAVVFPVLYAIRRARWYIPVVVRLGSVVLIVISSVWLVERAFDVEIVNPLRRFVGGTLRALGLRA